MAATLIWVGTYNTWWSFFGSAQSQGFSNWAVSPPTELIPGSTDIVEVKAGAVVDIGVAGSSAGTSWNDTSRSDGETIYNSGIIRLDASQTGSGFCSWIFSGTTGIGYDPSSTGTGSAAGSILLSDNAKNSITVGSPGSGDAATLIDVDNDISGAGQISGLYGSTLIIGQDSLGKQTIVNANGNNALSIANFSAVNDGVLESTSSGGLSLASIVDQTHSTVYANNPKGLPTGSSKGAPSGIIEAIGTGAHVELGGVVIGGKLHTAGGGVINAENAALVGSHTDGAGAAAPVTIDGTTIQVVTQDNLKLVGEIDFTQGSVITVDATSAFNAAVDIGASGYGGSTTLKGAGVINLADVASNRAQLTDGNGGFAVSLDNQITIQGAGYVGPSNQVTMDITNEGTIDANGAHGLQVRASSFVNAGGLLESTNTGGLDLLSDVNNQNGTIAAAGAGAAVYLQAGVVQGGTVSTSGGGIVHIVGGGLDGAAHGAVTIAGNVQVDDNNSGTITGVVNIAANATLKLAGSASGANLSLTSTTTLTGAGAVVLSDVANRNRLTDNGNDQTLINQTTIQGAGFIGHNNQINFYFTNQGTVNANGVNNLVLGDTTLTNTNLIEATGAGGVTIEAGTFANSGALKAIGGAISVTAATFSDISGSTLSGGSYFVSANQSISLNNSAAITTLGASVTLGAGASFTTAGTAIGQSLTTIAAGGALNLAGATFVDANTLTVQAGGAASGFGAFNAAIVDSGAVTVQGGALAFDKSVSGNGAVNFTRGAGVEFSAASSVARVAFDIAPASASLDTLTLDTPASFTSTIANFEVGNDRIVLNGVSVASVSLSGPNAATGLSTLTAKNTAGATVAQLSLSGNFAGLLPVVASDGSIRLTTQHASDFSGDGFSDVAFENTAGAVATWQLTGASISGGATLGAPGAAWAAVGVGDEDGDGVADLIFANSTNGKIEVWRMAGGVVVAKNDFVGPGSSWKVVATGDFNGDGRLDILFRNAIGDLASWDMNADAIVGGGNIGNPGANWTFVGAGDFNGDRKSDLLFESTSGVFATWTIGDTAITGGATLGSPGQGWIYKGTGDFNGDGTSDILFENADSGQYATWDIKNDAIHGGGNILNPGQNYALKGIGSYYGTADSGLLFENSVTGQYSDFALNDTSVIGGGPISAPGAVWSVIGTPPAARQELPTMVFFQKSDGTISAWNVAGGVNAGGPSFGTAAGYTMMGVGDFYGDLKPDVLFRNASGAYALWQTNGASIIGGGAIGNPGGTYAYVGLGDFNGDATSDILFKDSSGNYATWDLHGTLIIGGATIGNPGAGWGFAAIGDFNGDGTSDLLFVKAGAYSSWDIGDNRITGGGAIGSPGAGWTLKGSGDFNGDGKSDLLFENASGVYATWDIGGNSIVGGGTLGNPGAAWAFAGIADIFGNHQDSILFYNASTNAYSTWNLNDGTVRNGSNLGSPGAGWAQKAFI